METVQPDRAVRPSPGPEHLLGPEARRRFDFQGWGHRRRRIAGEAIDGRIGSLATQTDQFVAVIGRSMASRRMIGQRFLVGVGGTGQLPVRPPDEYFPIPGERRRFAVSPSEAERRSRSFWEIQERMTTVRRRDNRAPPPGLPRATARAGHSRAGRQTGPTGAPGRMVSQAAFVSNPREVGWSGRLVSGSDRLTVGTGSARGRPPPGPPSVASRSAPALGPSGTVAPFLSPDRRPSPSAGTVRRASGPPVGPALAASVAGFSASGATVARMVTDRSSQRPSERVVAAAGHKVTGTGALPARRPRPPNMVVGVPRMGSERAGSATSSTVRPATPIAGTWRASMQLAVPEAGWASRSDRPAPPSLSWGRPLLLGAGAPLVSQAVRG
ncbi:MAG TPA: hypothetical protein VEJ84_21070, partial [Acidimicrobiales bacterium]|nr:hypothetical protein [Acidimicrobiales bacterium]